MRVPIIGMRKNVVPRVPTIEPAVETPPTVPETVPECRVALLDKSDCKRRIDTQQRNWQKHEGERGVETAEAHIVYGVKNETQYCFGKARQNQEVQRRNPNYCPEDGCRYRAIADKPAKEITGGERHTQHRRDQYRPLYRCRCRSTD